MNSKENLREKGKEKYEEIIKRKSVTEKNTNNTINVNNRSTGTNV